MMSKHLKPVIHWLSSVFIFLWAYQNYSPFLFKHLPYSHGTCTIIVQNWDIIPVERVFCHNHIWQANWKAILSSEAKIKHNGQIQSYNHNLKMQVNKKHRLITADSYKTIPPTARTCKKRHWILLQECSLSFIFNKVHSQLTFYISKEP